MVAILTGKALRCIAPYQATHIRWSRRGCRRSCGPPWHALLRHESNCRKWFRAIWCPCGEECARKGLVHKPRDLAAPSERTPWDGHFRCRLTAQTRSWLPADHRCNLSRYLSVKIYSARFASSARLRTNFGMFGWGLSKRIASLSAPNSGVLAIEANGGA
jgi:hypothetical protein